VSDQPNEISVVRGRGRGRRVALAAVALLGVGVLAFGVLAPPERCPQPTAASIDRSAAQAVQWFARNQHPDGTWLYEYDTAADVDLGGYNLVRHAGAVMGLYQAAAAGQPDALASADRGMAWSASTSSSTTTGRHWPTTGGRRRAVQRCSRPGWWSGAS